jgi:hypothetical protein
MTNLNANAECAALLTMLTTQATDVAQRFERWRVMLPYEVLAEMGALRASLNFLDDTIADFLVELKEANQRAVSPLPPGTSRLGVTAEGAA